jgi:hypothetical protein
VFATLLAMLYIWHGKGMHKLVTRVWSQEWTLSIAASLAAVPVTLFQGYQYGLAPNRRQTTAILPIKVKYLAQYLSSDWVMGVFIHISTLSIALVNLIISKSVSGFDN